MRTGGGDREQAIGRLAAAGARVMSRAWQVELEVICLRLQEDGRLATRSVRGALAAGTAPDDLAAELAECSGGVCHSTSWHCEGDDVLVLTYAAAPDGRPDLPARPLPVPLVVAGGGALSPAPDDLREHHVAAHAVRHLADLARRDPQIRSAAGAQRPLWEAVVAAAGDAEHRVETAAS